MAVKKKEEERRAIQLKLLKLKEEAKAHRLQNLCYFFKPYKWQEERVLSVIGEKNTTVVTSSNKIGKTALGSNIVISWALGFEPWNEVTEYSEGTVKHNGKFYKPSSLGIKPPVDIIITGEDWKIHIGKTLIPELMKWAPVGQYETKKNEQGVEYSWKWKNGSTFLILCYTQDTKAFESFRCQGIWPDEPIPQDKFNALSRGLLLDHGKKFLTLTPLSEAWILDELVLSGRKDIAVVDGLIITENEKLHADDVKILKESGLGDHQVDEFFKLLLYKDVEKNLPVEDKGAKAERFLESVIPLDKQSVSIGGLHLLNFIKDIPPSEVPPRVFGIFKALVGRVLKQFNSEKHWIEPFDVPTDWPMIAMIDFHLKKPHAISYHTVNKQDIKFICKEIWEHLSPEGVSDSIIRDKKANAWNIRDAYIDPLSKGDTAYMKNRMGTDLVDSFSIISERLARHGITLWVASKDKDSGIRNIWKDLEGVNSIPTYYVFNTCKRHLVEINRWIYDDNGKPAKGKEDDFDDMMENWYRATLTGLKWVDFRHKQVEYRDPVGSGAWMGM